MSPSVKHPRAFILAEAIILVLVVAAIAAILAVMAGESPRQASLGDDLANLKRLGAAHAAYGGDNDDRFGTFTWQPGIDYGFGGAPQSPTEAAANQAVSILRERAGRTDIQPITNWIPNLSYSTLVLVDYLNGDFLSPALVSPQDRLRLLWRSDPEEGFYNLPLGQRPEPLGDGNNERRWPYSSSYEMAPASWSRDAGDGTNFTTSQGAVDRHGTFMASMLPMGDRRQSQVAFPAHKALMYDQFQRHVGPQVAFFGYAPNPTTPAGASGARVPVLRADGAAAIAATGETNRGWQNPNNPGVPGPARYPYRPSSWEPPTLSGAEADFVFGYDRWTRSGLRGRDFGGPEIPWTP